MCVDWTVETRNSGDICPVSRIMRRKSHNETLCVPPAFCDRRAAESCSPHSQTSTCFGCFGCWVCWCFETQHKSLHLITFHTTAHAREGSTHTQTPHTIITPPAHSPTVPPNVTFETRTPLLDAAPPSADIARF